MSVKVLPYTYSVKTQSRANHSRPLSLQSHLGQNVAFGDDSGGTFIPPNYHLDMHPNSTTSILDMEQAKDVTEGSSLEDVFCKLYDKVNNISKKEANGGYYEKMPIDKNLYVKAMSGFAKENGLKPTFVNRDVAVENHIRNNMGIPKPHFWQIKKVEEYDKLLGCIVITSFSLLEKGLVIIKKVK